MERKRFGPGLSTRLSLLLLLLAAQSLALAHDAGHLAAGDTICTTCSIGYQLEHPTCETQPGCEAPGNRATHPDTPLAHRTFRRAAAPIARSPPAPL